MGTRQQDIRVTWLRRLVRGRRPDRNPLRRASDRLETAVLAVLVIAFLVGAPFTALASAEFALAKAHQAQLTEQASWHQVPARVLKLESQAAAEYASQSEARGRWTAPDGKVVTGDIPVPFGTVPGATVRVWVAHDGQLTDPPMQNDQVTDQAYFAGTFSVIALAIVLASVGMLTRRALDKRRMTAWDAEWRTTGPRWTTRA
jgi:hypothetical protein